MAQALSSFIPFLSHNSLGSQSSLDIANRLEISQKQHQFYEKSATIDGVQNGNANLEVAALQLDAVMEMPMVSSRAGLYVFLNSLVRLICRRMATAHFVLACRSSTYRRGHDRQLFAIEVQGMHSSSADSARAHCRQIDQQNMATDLVTASFDILANAMYCSEPTSTIFYLKSFLINKVPLLVTQLSGSIFPLTPEMSITQALAHVDLNAFPAFSQGFDDIMGGNSSLSDVRQDFLNACVLHGHITNSAVERLLGEKPIQGPPATRYEKKTLLEQCKNNFDKINAYIDEMENLDGNAAAIVGAVTDVSTLPSSPNPC